MVTSTEKTFRVQTSFDKSHIDKFFKTRTAIRTLVTLPFDEEEYRVTMFDGLFIKLVGNKGEIKGSLA